LPATGSCAAGLAGTIGAGSAGGGGGAPRSWRRGVGGTYSDNPRTWETKKSLNLYFHRTRETKKSLSQKYLYSDQSEKSLSQRYSTPHLCLTTHHPHVIHSTRGHSDITAPTRTTTVARTRAPAVLPPRGPAGTPGTASQSQGHRGDCIRVIVRGVPRRDL